MTWTDKLIEFSGFGGQPHRSEMSSLLPLMTAALAAITKVADLAPTPIAQAETRPVADKAQAVVERMRDAVRDFGHVVPAAGVGSPQATGQNHWARLLEALEQHREVRQRLRELSISVEEDDPTLSEVLASIGREEEGVVDHLRNLIARADPQALN